MTSLAASSLAPAARLARAQAHLDAGETLQGLELIRARLVEDPHDVPFLLAFAKIQRDCGVLDIAEQACRIALEAEPAHADSELMLARVLQETDVAAALAAVARVLAGDPGHRRARLMESNMLKAAGRFGEARQRLLAMIADDPHWASAYGLLADLDRFAAGHPALEPLQAAVAAAERGARPDAPALRYALGKACADLGDADAAFAQYAAGARLKRAQIDYDEAEMGAFFGAVTETFTRELIAGRGLDPEAPPPGPLPVFIVGMPRSGSTLVEAILARHRDVHAEGERRSFTASFAPLYAADPGLPAFPWLAATLGRAQLERLGAAFLAHAERHAPAARVFVNKLPGNIFFLGLIRMALPQARFVLTERDPIDTCWSAFTTLFADEVGYSYDQNELGRYYRRHAALVRHWAAVMGERALIRVRYEEVVADIEGAARALLDQLGLLWDPDCLDFHESERAVRTASASQVRRPLYASSVGRWRPYARHLAPLIAALGDEADASGPAR